jgi:hypothetical protein
MRQTDASRRRAVLRANSGGGTRTHNLSLNRRAHLPIELPRTELPRVQRGAARIVFAASNLRQLGPPGLHLGVTVGAEQNALTRLRSGLLERARDPSVAQ